MEFKKLEQDLNDFIKKYKVVEIEDIHDLTSEVYSYLQEQYHNLNAAKIEREFIKLVGGFSNLETKASLIGKRQRITDNRTFDQDDFKDIKRYAIHDLKEFLNHLKSLDSNK